MSNSPYATPHNLRPTKSPAGGSGGLNGFVKPAVEGRYVANALCLDNVLRLRCAENAQLRSHRSDVFQEDEDGSVRNIS